MSENNIKNNPKIKETEDRHKQKDERLSPEIEKLKTERDEYLKGWQKERASFINYKKEEKDRFREIINFSNERLIKSLITVLDSFNLALLSFTKQEKDEEKNENYLKGVYLIKSQLEDILQKEGVEAIIAKPGEKFDPTYYEAIAEVESEEFKPQTIVEMLEKGYILNGKLIRPCRVIVAKKGKSE